MQQIKSLNKEGKMFLPGRTIERKCDVNLCIFYNRFTLNNKYNSRDDFTRSSFGLWLYKLKERDRHWRLFTVEWDAVYWVYTKATRPKFLRLLGAGGGECFYHFISRAFCDKYFFYKSTLKHKGLHIHRRLPKSGSNTHSHKHLIIILFFIW